VDIYRAALQVVTLHGPTNFSRVIRHAANLAEPYAHIKNSNDDLKYFILLIITDGVINDMQDTINEVVRASEYPMSIIIVGVGDEDFSMMDELDADERPLYSTATKKFMMRDIVQFVPFNDFKDRSYHELAMATLDEVPREVVNYFMSKNIPPRGLDENGNRVKQQEQPEKKMTPAEAQRKANVLAIKQKEAEEAAKKPTSLALRKEELPKYLLDEKARLMQSAVSQGYPRDEVEHSVEEGLPSMEVELLVDILTNGERGVGGPFAHALKSSSHAVPNRQKSEAATEDAAQEYNPFPPDDQITVGAAMDARRGSRAATKKRRNTNMKPPVDTDDVANLCKVCFENPIDTVILDCGHQIVCSSCSKVVGNLCPLCREPIDKIIKSTM